jgi:membrane-bound ClpP family serine protease
MENSADLISEKDSQNRLNNWVAVAVAILAAFMAVTKVKDDNIVQAMLQDKSDAVDTWSQFQSKSIKQHLAELGREQTQALRSTVTAQNASQLDEQVKSYEAEIDRYKQETKELQDKAQGYEAQYDALNYRDDQFDLSDAALSVALAMLAVTALTGKRWLLWASLVFAGFGLIMGLAGLFGLHLHPDALSRLLT